MPSEDVSQRWFDALHGDLKGLDDKVQRVENVLSEMKGERIGGRLEKLENNVNNLENFKSRALGALLIVALIWSPLCAVITGLLVWWITKSG